MRRLCSTAPAHQSRKKKSMSILTPTHARIAIARGLLSKRCCVQADSLCDWMHKKKMKTYKFKCPRCGCDKLCKVHVEAKSREVTKIYERRVLSHTREELTGMQVMQLRATIGDPCYGTRVTNQPSVFECARCSRCWPGLMDIYSARGLVECTEQEDTEQ